MENPSKSDPRPYHAPRRQAAATRTREAIVRAGQHLFEQRGWAGTTMAAIADRAGVSQKSVEAIFGTKAALLEATVDYTIRGDTDPLPMTQRESVKEMEAAPDAATMLRLHAAHLRAINPRSARIAWTVEHAAASDLAVAKLWQRMNASRTFAVRNTTERLFRKPGRKRFLQRDRVEAAFWVAIDWGTYRTLTQYGGHDDDGYEAWLRHYYRDTFLPSGEAG
ncbi:MAG TPA: TetR/AcrR family transcriptional regulator [Solirubrobacteraceae bacterium]